MHTSCFGEPRIPSAQTSLDIGTPFEPKHLGSAPMAFNKMSSEELRLAKQWYDEDGKTPLEMSLLLRRDKSTITRHVVKRTKQKRNGRPRAHGVGGWRAGLPAGEDGQEGQPRV